MAWRATPGGVLSCLLLLVLGAGCATPAEDAAPVPRSASTADGVHVLQLELPPGGLPFNAPFELVVQVSRVDGAPLADDVRLLPSGWMPDHGHGLVQHPRAERLEDGRFATHGWLLHMAGLWELRFDVLQGEPGGREAVALRGDELTRATFEVVLP